MVIKVLFVCTGNIFRSASAALFANALNDIDIKASSAGTIADHQEMFSLTTKTLVEYNIDPTLHVQRKLTRRIVEAADVIICMAEHHKIFIKEHFNAETNLYNELAIGKSTDLQDDTEYFHTHERTEEAFDTFVVNTVQNIHDTIPIVVQKCKLLVK